ncbi:hypothetical protein COLO4_28206 [Corchorus olitorius]|uniref:Uncharacterized protein n=1 Tax=Corchorus olitorius TaxID=93759 RepID=A0A1R3HMD4_9ROSI|nr:hypothetical protein COLO4_28206 [Corchorus olitorius]
MEENPNAQPQVDGIEASMVFYEAGFWNIIIFCLKIFFWTLDSVIGASLLI